MPRTPYTVLGGRNHCGQHCWDTDSNVGTFSRKGFCVFYFTVRLILLVLYKTSGGSKSQCFVTITWCCLGSWTFMSLGEFCLQRCWSNHKEQLKHCMICSQAWTWKSPSFSLFGPFLLLEEGNKKTKFWNIKLVQNLDLNWDWGLRFHLQVKLLLELTNIVGLDVRVTWTLGESTFYPWNSCFGSSTLCFKHKIYLIHVC